MKERCSAGKCHGYHYCKPVELGWLEVCTNCSFEQFHHNRRRESVKINFKDRRKGGASC